MAYSIQHLYRNSVALLCVVFVMVLAPCLTAISYLQERSAIEQIVATQARMLAVAIGGENRMSPFAINSILPSVVANPSLKLTCIYDAMGNVSAFRNGAAFSSGGEYPPSCGEILKNAKSSGDVLIEAPVIRKNLPEPIGKVMMLAKPPQVLANFVTWLIVSVLLCLLLALFCWALGQKLHYALLKPIRQIASTAQRVSLYKDYSLRVVPGALDVAPREIQSLTDSFNAMLKEIEDRDARLSRKSSELDRARVAAESASLAKSQFLANVSHELRTPLNAIIGFSAMLGNEQFGPLGNAKYVEYSRDIQDSGKHLLDVINDILDLTKAEAGKLSVTFASLNLTKIIEKALRIVAGHAYERKVDIYMDVPEKLPKIIADPVRLVQILLNVLSNAIKFSHEGGKITVRARAESARQGVHYFTLDIEDHGIGMSEADIRKAFSTFNQADAGLNRKYEGAGLGLPLTKRLVDLHHGKIKIESKVGEGTTVTIRLTSDPSLLD